MPFTISHIAAVLPFTRPLARWRLLSASVIGSMIPDFGLLMPWRPERSETHSPLSLLTFCLPVGLATFWVFQEVLKRPVMAVLPDAAHRRWSAHATPADMGSLTQWILAACGILAGAMSHLIWDGFTHEGALGVRMVPLLEEPVVDIAGHQLMGPRLLQDASSLVGLVLVLGAMAFALRPGNAAAVPRALRQSERYRWIAVYVLVSLVLSGVFFLHKHPFGTWTQPISVMVGFVAIAALRGSATGVVAVSLALIYRMRADEPTRAGRSSPRASP